MKLTERERIEILMMIGYGDRTRTQEEVCRLFNEAHPDRPPVVRSTVSKIERKFRVAGHVRDLPKVGRPSVGADVELNVLLQVQEDPHTNSRECGRDVGTSHNTVLRVLKRHRFHPYKVHLVQELSDDDYDRRQQFCEQMMEICNVNPAFVNNILFTDESTFCLNGTVNRQNCRYWAAENPRWMLEAHSQRPQKVNVWGGIIGNRVLGPFFIEGTLDGNRYLDFLQTELIPALAVLYPNEEDPDVPDPNVWLQQDGAPPHYAAAVRAYLNQVFPNRWIGRRGAIEWPPRSPDLTPLDYFLWGYLKSKVYENRPRDVEQLKGRIREEMRRITPETIQNVLQEFQFRLGYCQEVNGQQFEHLL